MDKMKLNKIQSDIINRLEQGNSRFIRGEHISNISPKRRKEISQKQTPLVTILTCSDSRVPPEYIFDLGLGEIFVVRIAGNIIDDTILDTLEYGCIHLGIPVIIIMGHTRCGAIILSVRKMEEKKYIGSIINSISPIIKKIKKNYPDLSEEELVEMATKENVDIVASKIIGKSELIRKKILNGELAIFKGLYDINSGKVELKIM